VTGNDPFKRRSGPGASRAFRCRWFLAGCEGEGAL